MDALGGQALPNPLISCIMPTRNRRRWVEMALRCFAHQTYSPLQLVVVEDGLETVADLLGPDPKRHLLIRMDGSFSAKRNEAIRRCDGDLIALFDDDDWSGPDRIQNQYQAMLDHRAAIAGVQGDLFYELEDGEFWTVSEDIRKRMWLGDVHGGAILFTREVWKESPFREDTPAADGIFVRDASTRGRAVASIPSAGQYVYVRHPAIEPHQWKFKCGEYIDPAGWSRLPGPPEPMAPYMDFYERISGRSEHSCGRRISRADRFCPECGGRLK